MLLPAHNYVRPASLDDCLKALREAGDAGQIVAGGTDVIFNMRLKLFRPETVISVRKLAELQNIEFLPDGGVRIGTACRLHDLSQHPLLNDRWPAFTDAVRQLASQHVRNMGTLGGNICLKTRCWYTNNSAQWREGRSGCFKTDGQLCHVIKSSDKCHAINNADMPVVLIALGATLTIQKFGAERQLPIADLYRDDGLHNLTLDADELVTHVTIPPVDDRTVYVKQAARQGIDFAIGSVAGRCDGTGEQAGKVTLVLGSVSTAPVVLKEPAAIIESSGLTDEAIERACDAVRDELGEVTNLYSRAGYKKQVARVLVRRALRRLREM